MTIANHLFHNIYLREEIFSHAEVGHQYCETKNGDLIAEKGLTKLLELKANFENDLIFTSSVMSFAAIHGQLDTIIWLHTNLSMLDDCTTTVMDMAAWRGHLEIIQWLHTNTEFHCTPDAIYWAAMNGHLHVVQWLHANRDAGGINLTGLVMIGAMFTAAKWGRLPVVKWLYKNNNYNAGYTRRAIKIAAKKRDKKVAQWLQKQLNK